MISLLFAMISLFFAYIILDVGLSSIFAYFHIEGWMFFLIAGIIIGLIKALLDGNWYVITPLFFGLLGYIIAVFRFDGMVIAIILGIIYYKLHERSE